MSKLGTKNFLISTTSNYLRSSAVCKDLSSKSWLFWFSRWNTLTCQIIVQQILLFLGEKNTYTTLLGPTRLLVFEIFPSKHDFHLHKWEKNPSYTALLRPTRLLISEKSATYTIKWSYTIIWQVRVFEKFMWIRC